MDFVRDPFFFRGSDADGFIQYHPGATLILCWRSNLTKGFPDQLWKLATKSPAWQFFVPFWGGLSDHLERLSDLQLGNQKVTLNHLVLVFSCSFPDDLRFVEG